MFGKFIMWHQQLYNLRYEKKCAEKGKDEEPEFIFLRRTRRRYVIIRDDCVIVFILL